MDVERQAGVGLPGKVEEEHALDGAHVDALVGSQQGGDVLVDAQAGNAEGQHTAAIVTAEGVVGAEPHIAVLILHNIAHGIGCQPVVHGDEPVAIVVAGTGWQQAEKA